eukprot:464706-Pyramimonas_sp.AAC.1
MVRTRRAFCGRFIKDAEQGKNAEFTFLSPGPQVMRWDSECPQVTSARSPAGDPYSLLAGWLNAPLFYDEVASKYALPPCARRRARGVPAKQRPAARGPLLSHGGGTGST